MNLLKRSHIIKISGKVDKNDIIVNRIDAEKIILLLSSPNKPQFILINGSLLNTSFIIGVVESPNLDWNVEPEKRELTNDEKLIHEKYLQHINNNTKLLK